MGSNTRLINLIKAVVIILTAAAILAGSFKVLVLKSEDGINQMQALYRQPDNSVDVLFLGSSLVFCDISTGVLWDDHGVAAFDMGGAEAPAWVSYYQLKEALKTQSPKVICYEVSTSAMYQMPAQSDEWSSDNNYGMKWNFNRISQLWVNSERDDFFRRLNPFNIMHGRYTDLTENDFVNVRDSADYKGFDPREYVVDAEKPDMDKDVGKTPCTPKAEDYTRRIIRLAKEKGTGVILFVSPYYISDDERRVCNYMKDIAASEGAEFIDFNERYDEMDIDFSKDMSTGHHLSYTGNYKFSDYLGKVLKEKYDLPDRRGDERYLSWEKDSAMQRNERNDLEILNCGDIEEIRERAVKGYVLFAAHEGTAAIYDNGECVASAGIDETGNDPFRLTYSAGKDSFLFEQRREGEEEKPSYHVYINDTEYKGSGDDVLMVYDSLRREYVRTVAVEDQD